MVLSLTTPNTPLSLHVPSLFRGIYTRTMRESGHRRGRGKWVPQSLLFDGNSAPNKMPLEGIRCSNSFGKSLDPGLLGPQNSWSLQLHPGFQQGLLSGTAINQLSV